MSVRWITWAWEQECSSAGQKLTLIALADHAGEDGACWPSTGRIAIKTGQGASTVRRHVDLLAEAGLLTCEVRHREDGSQTSSIIRLGQGGARIEQGGAQIDTPTPYPDRAGGCSPVSTRSEPSMNRQKEPSPLSPDEEPRIVPDQREPFEIFWAQYPRKVGKPAAEKAFKRAIKKAADDAILVGLQNWCDHWTARNQPQFIPYPATWLNDERWNNDPPPLPSPKQNLSTGAAALQSYMNRRSIS